MSVKIHNFCAHPIDRSLAKVVKETIPTGANLDKYIASLVELDNMAFVGSGSGVCSPG
jgi:hypothetical protein